MGTDKTVGNLVERIAEGDIEPTGTVKFQMMDERGKVIDQEEAPNFISKTWKAHARAVLRQRWMQFGYNRQFIGNLTAAATDTITPFSWASTPLFAADAICCWNDTTVEDSVNEHTPNIPATGIIAWASRWPIASPTGRRGSVDIVNSLVNDTTVRHIFDWNTSQGNGTFQSVGWLRMGAPGAHLLSGGTQHRVRSSVTFTPAALIATSTAVNPSNCHVDLTTGVAYTIIRGSTGGFPSQRVVSFPAATALSSSGISIVGSKATDAQAFTNVSSEFTPTSSLSSSIGVHSVLGRITGATVFGYPVNATDAGITHRWGVVTDGTATNTTYNFPTTGFVRGAVIGTDLYAAAGGDSNIYKLNTSTGATISTITIDANVTAHCTLAGITIPRVVAMCANGTDLFVAYGQNHTTNGSKVLVFRLNVAGVCQQIIGSLPHYQASGSIIDVIGAPYAGNHYYPNSWWGTEYSYGGLSIDAVTTASTVEDIASGVNSVTGDASFLPWFGDGISQSALSTMTFYDGSLFFGNWAQWFAVTGLTYHTWYRQGFDLGSRVLLATSKVKTAAQTMKITYDITMPGWL